MTSKVKDRFINNGEDIYSHYQDGKATGIYITKIPPYSLGGYRKTDTTYSVRNLKRGFGEVKSFRKAKVLAIAHAP